MFVFRFGKVLEYDETYACESWSNDQLMKAVSFYATCIQYGIEIQEAYSLSFMYVTMENHPDVEYSSFHKKKIESIFNHVEKA